MTPKLEFCLLGPVEVVRGGVVVPVPRGRQRAMLALLLLNAGRVVSVGEIAEALWGPAPPPSAAVRIRNYVKRLRRALQDGERTRIVTRSPGYLILIEPGELDVSRFAALLESARSSALAGSWTAAADRAGEALALWRGAPLADIESRGLMHAEVSRLAELRLQATELRINAELRLGHHRAVIPDLDRLAAAHPLREHLHALLMLALFHDGRQAEALAAFQRARRLLVDELGAEPGAELTDLHRHILADRPVRARAAGPRQVVPRELPGPVPQFTGREAELAALTGMLGEGRGRNRRALLVAAICGMAGAGKTALATQWAHQVASRFPDGQLHVNMRGYDPGQPVLPASALAAFLRSLGVAEQDIPADGADRAARYRSLLATRRMLIVIDNARDADQVRPLLPGNPSCAAVVTSRDALAGLVARDGARRLELGLLPPPDAVKLLGVLIGARVDQEPEAAVTLAGHCGRLPLALRVAAERAAAAPALALADLLPGLADQHERLDALNAAGDQAAAVRAVFSWSVRHLDDQAARAFRLLGLHPGPDLDVYAAAALTDTSLRTARSLLDRLARAYLVQPTATARYGMHDLLRGYAAEQAGDQERTAALTRLSRHYLATAAVAARTLFPGDPDQPPLPRAAGPVRPVDRPDAALAWLDAERSALVAVAAYAADRGCPGHAIGLSASIFRYLDAGHFSDAAAVHGHARRAAAQTGDRRAEATALTMLATFVMAQGQLGPAAVHLEEAQALCRAAGDKAGEARVLGTLGVAAYCEGRYSRSNRCHRLALALCAELGDSAGEARELHHLGVVNVRLGHYEQAAGQLERALEFFRAAGIRSGEAHVLNTLGELQLRLGNHRAAADHLRRSLQAGRESGSRLGQARALTGLGLSELGLGHGHVAVSHLRESLALHRQAGNKSGQAEALNGLGEAFLATSRAAEARTWHAAALSLAINCGDKREQARARRASPVPASPRRRRD